MAAKRQKRKAGRPFSDDPMSERVLCRLDKATKAALEEYVSRKGLGGASTALRVIVMDRLRAEGLLK